MFCFLKINFSISFYSFVRQFDVEEPNKGDPLNVNSLYFFTKSSSEVNVYCAPPPNENDPAGHSLQLTESASNADPFLQPKSIKQTKHR